MAAADVLLENTDTLSQAVLEEIIAVYIDARDTEKAAEAVQRLLKDYGEYGYGSGPVPCLKKLLFMKGSISHAFNIFIPWEKKHRN